MFDAQLESRSRTLNSAEGVGALQQWCSRSRTPWASRKLIAIDVEPDSCGILKKENSIAQSGGRQCTHARAGFPESSLFAYDPNLDLQ
jgi:hypothetical protein